MPRTRNPFGPKNRPVPISKRRDLSKKGIKILPATGPSESVFKQYRKDLDEFSDTTIKFTEDALGNLPESTGIFSFIGSFLSFLIGARSRNRENDVAEIAGKFTAHADRDQERKFNASTNKIEFQTISSPGSDSYIKEQLGIAVFQNVSLIKNLDDKYFNDVQRMVFSLIGIELPPAKESIPGKGNNKLSKKKVLQPTPVEDPQIFSIQDLLEIAPENISEIPVPAKESMLEKLQEIDGVTKSRAQLIARDQTQKVFSALEEARGKDSGFVWYIWSGADDNRERDSHRKNNNKIFHVDFPPEETGPPGQAIQCRCRRRWLVSRSQVKGIKESDIGYTDPATRKKVYELLKKEQES